MGIWIYGTHTVLNVVEKRPKAVKEILLVKSKGENQSSRKQKVEELLKIAEEHSISYKDVDASYLSGLSGLKHDVNHQRVLAYIEPKAIFTLRELLKKDSGKDSVYLMLDGVTDANNLGAIIRTATAFKVRGLILPKDRSASINDDVYKTSVGTIEDLDICVETNLVRAVEELKKEGFWVYGLEEDASNVLVQADFKGRVCCVIGGEDTGVRSLLSKNCDMMLRIPMSDRVQSVNVSVSVAVVLYEIQRQKHFSKLS